ASPEAATPITRTTTYAYTAINGRSLLTQIDGPLPNGPNGDPNDSDITRFDWDARGNRVVRVTHPMALVETLEYALDGVNPTGLLTARTDVSGVRTELRWAESAVRIALVHRAGVTLNFEHDTLGRTRAMSRNDGARVAVEYDNTTVRYTLPDGEMREFDLDTESRPVVERWLDAEQRVLFDRQRIEYDASHKPEIRFTDAAGIITRVRDDPTADERMIARGHGAARLTQTARFDPVQHLLRIERNETITEVRSDPEQAERSLRLPNGATHRFWRDDFGRTVRIEHPDSGAHVATYDEADRLIERRDPLRSSSARYDALGRLIQLRHATDGSGTIVARAAAGPEEHVQWHYEGASLVRHVSNQQDSRYAYDANARLSETQLRLRRQTTSTTPAAHGFGSADRLEWLPELVTRYERDNFGRIVRVDLPEGAVLTQRYDARGHVEALALQAPATGWWQKLLRLVWAKHGTQDLISDIEHSSSLGPQGYRHGNGFIAQAEHDATGRMVSWQDGPLRTRLQHNEHAQLSILTTESPKQLGPARATVQALRSREQHLSYDPFGRLRQIGEGEHIRAIDYDDNGNRVSQRTTALGSVRYVLAEHSDRLLAIKPTQGQPQRRYEHNRVGEPIRIETRTGSTHSVRYDPQGQIAAVERDGHLLAHYAYNGARQRVAKTVFHGNKKTTSYFTWYGGLLDAELDDHGRVERRTIYLNLRPVALLAYDYGADEQRTPTRARHLAIHGDHLGTPLAITDSQQRVIWLADYDAFGRAQVRSLPRNLLTPKASGTSLIGTAHATSPDRPFEFHLRFAGQYEDIETGWHYNWHRYYDPETGRYLTPDPIGIRGGNNSYAYVGNDPFGAVDPDGLIVIISGHSAAGILGSITSPDSYHLSIVIIPDNPDDFIGGLNWRTWNHGNWGGSGVNHTIYQTIGGQPQGPSASRPPIGNLITAKNYDGDGPEASTFCQVVQPPNGMTDTEFIRALVESSEKYSNDQRYSFPDIFFNGHMPEGWYNSNSYVAGLLADVIGLAPTLNIPGRWVSRLGVQTWVYDFQTPGYQNPLPMR
ncbi:MAG: RHS repeat-associated core domain-containing protein, partial [Burkholderiaceae bacterium]|nr:RHS repeat-associated core domain-containing protein [Burkholderiaceae bacterium]